MNSNSTTTETAHSRTNPAPESSAPEISGCCADQPPATREHAWLRQFVGEWESDVEASLGPDQPPMKSRAVTRSRMIGDYWLIEEGQNVNFPYAYLFTLGFDVQRGRFVGSWADTMQPHLWTYEGSLDATGRILTLETEGPLPMQIGRKGRYRERSEVKSPDLRVFTSAIQAEDGTWSTFLTVTSRRKK